MASPHRQLPLSLPTLLGGLSLLLLVLGGVFVRAELQTLLARPGPFLLGVLLSELLFLPRITVLVASGLLFSPIEGALYTLLGDLVAAALVYALGRASFGKTLGPRLYHTATLTPYLPLREGPKSALVIAVFRILPIAHYSSLSLLGGTLGFAPLWFMLGTLLGNLPTALLYPLAARGLTAWDPRMVTAALGLLALFTLLAVLFLHRMRNRAQ